MQKRLDKNINKKRIVIALLESLADNSIIIKRNALDLIRNFYPLGIKYKKTMITLMRGFEVIKKQRSYLAKKDLGMGIS